MRGTEPVAARDPGSKLPAGWQHGAFMEIFVRSYRDGNGDGIGDLRGLIQSLDYLEDLGVRGLWLMPIHPSEDRDHNYAVTDYRAIDPDYGTLEEFDELLFEAHARGIGVIIDYVINHSAAKHPLFQQARQGPDNAYRDWYVWQAEHPKAWRIYEHDPWRRDGGASYFAAFSRHMPDFNWLNPAVVAWHHDNLRFWLNRGVDGFRFDAVGHLVENGPEAWDCQPQNYPLMADIRRLLDGYARRFMVCEVPGDPAGFGRIAGSAFAFDLNGRLLDAARGDAQALHFVARYFERTPASLSTLLSNHDSFAGQRVHDQVEGDTAVYRLAAAMYLLLPGTPFIYYGEEVGKAGHPGLPPDPGLRTPMSWTADLQNAGFTPGRPYRPPAPNVATHNVAQQRADAGSLHAHYRALLALRNGRPSVAQGRYEAGAVQGSSWVFHRRLASEHTLVVVNTGVTGATVPLRGLPASGALTPLYPRGAAQVRAAASGCTEVVMPGQSLQVFDCA